jgi:FkbM family methyltransferase
MFLPPKWRGIGRLIFTFREHYEPELAYLEKVLSSGKTFVDVGASFGIYTVAASRMVGDTGRVLAFEPSVQSFPVLQKNIDMNNLRNVIAFRVALSDKGGGARLYHAPDPSGNSLGRDPSFDGGGEEVMTESLDYVLQRASVDRVDVIKMDVQGAEELVLRGASRVVNSMRPLIIFEVYPNGAAYLGLSPNGAREMLESLGYEFFRVGESGPVVWTEPRPAYFNVVAIPGKLQ